MSAPSQPSTAPAAATAPSAAAPQATALPSAACMLQAARIAIQQDKPIQMDYYVDTASQKAFMGEDEQSKERMLVKSNEEFTSLVQHTYKVGEDFIMVTENSIYVVSGKIQKRRIQASQLRDD
jgi:3-oxoacyl-ACP reductase-like protein